MSATSSKILINNVDYTAYCSAEDLDITNSVALDQDTATFYIELNGELPAPDVQQEIVWELEGVREFGGVIQQILEVDLGTALQYQITAVSYEFWMNRHLVNSYFGQDYADNIVKNIVGEYTTGFTTNHVNTSYLIPPMYVQFKSVTDTIKQIAQTLSWGFYVDYYKDVHFFPIESFVSPLPNNSLNADGSADTKSWSNLKVTLDASQLKTRVYLLGFKSRVSTPVTLTFVGDGKLIAA